MIRHIYLLAQGLIKDPDSSVNLPRVVVTSGPNGTIASVLKLVFVAAGGISLLIITVAGLKFTLSNGDPQGIAKAKNAIIYALLGLVVCLAGFSIVNFVVNRV